MDDNYSESYAKRRLKELEKQNGMSTRTLIAKIENEEIDENEGDYPEWVFLNGLLNDESESEKDE